jgi:antitoxin component YwqK of YwqJK toxin-antitoxin module
LVFRVSTLCSVAMLMVACAPAESFVDCPKGSYADGYGPPLGKRIVCLSGQDRSAGARPYRHGPEVRWFAGGAMRSKQTFVHDELVGTAETWFSNGKLSKQGDYAADVRDGLWTEWAYGGHLRSKTAYRAGKIHGIRQFFYPDGKVKSEHIYHDGVLHGAAKAYHANGALKYEGDYRHNVRHGVWRSLTPEGYVVDELYFRDGRPAPSSAPQKIN